MSKTNFPPTPCNPAPVTAVGLHNLASLLDRGGHSAHSIYLGPTIDKEIGLAWLVRTQAVFCSKGQLRREKEVSETLTEC